jgi:S-adenosyl methyltransferase
MYDYLLGGDHHFATDRQAAQQALAAVPHLRDAAQANRAFLRDVVLYLLGQRPYR